MSELQFFSLFGLSAGETRLLHHKPARHITYEYTDNAHDVHMTRYATGGGDISRIRVKNA